MDFSKPELALGLFNATMTISSVGYFYHKLNISDKKLKELEDTFSEINDSMFDLEGNIDKIKKLNTKLNDFMDSVRENFMKNNDDLKHIKNLLEYQQECIESICKQLKQSNNSFELPEYQEVRRQNGRRRFNDEEDDFISQRQRRQQQQTRKKRDEDVEDTGRRTRSNLEFLNE